MRLKVRAYWHALGDMDYLPLQHGMLELAKTAKFPPTPAELRDAAQPYQRKLLGAATGSTGDWLMDTCIRNAKRIMRHELPIKRSV